MKKIRINGFVFHKHDIAWLIHRIAPLYYSGITMYYKYCTYKELCEILYKAMCKYGYKDSLKTIEWNNNIAPF